MNRQEVVKAFAIAAVALPALLLGASTTASYETRVQTITTNIDSRSTTSRSSNGWTRPSRRPEGLGLFRSVGTRKWKACGEPGGSHASRPKWWGVCCQAERPTSGVASPHSKRGTKDTARRHSSCSLRSREQKSSCELPRVTEFKRQKPIATPEQPAKNGAIASPPREEPSQGDRCFARL